MDRAQPAEEPFGFIAFHIDTAMAHWHAIVVMPISTMKSMTVFGEKASPGDAREDVGINI